VLWKYSFKKSYLEMSSELSWEGRVEGNGKGCVDKGMHYLQAAEG
jgi:hypothetical protein